MEKLIVAICYDFDKTLAVQDMQAFSLFPKLNVSGQEFWGKVKKFIEDTKCDPILAYLLIELEECKQKNIPLTKEFLHSLGENIEFYSGVETWFRRINEFAKSLNITLEHYIISSGNKEIIEGCKIAREFCEIFGCEFLFNEKGEAFWPKNIVNYTQKTQYLFRICKGTTDITDNDTINKRMDKKRVEFTNMIYIGDGVTDIPSMTLIKERGGMAISVYPPELTEVSLGLLKDKRVNYACKSDYSENSELDNLIKLTLKNIALKNSQ